MAIEEPCITIGSGKKYSIFTILIEMPLLYYKKTKKFFYNFYLNVDIRHMYK